MAESSSPAPHSYRPVCKRPAYKSPAIEATTDEINITLNFTFLVFMPLNSAASRFPPVARTRRPNVVFVRVIQPIITAVKLQSNNPGNQPIVPEPKIALNVSFKIGIG